MYKNIQNSLVHAEKLVIHELFLLLACWGIKIIGPTVFRLLFSHLLLILVGC